MGGLIVMKDISLGMKLIGNKNNQLKKNDSELFDNNNEYGE